MNRLFVFILVALCIPSVAAAQAKTSVPAAMYGNNPAAGHTFTHDGVRLYYEVYGQGEPVLVVHGNGGSVADVAAQIAYFRKRYKVIAMDSRDHGKSGDSQGSLTYERMSDDLAALVDELKIGPVYVLGWSDGGIEALLLAIRNPTKVKKIAIMGASLNPTEEAVYPEIIALVKSTLAGMSATEKATPQGRREVRVTQLLLDEPQIDPKALETITAPTLVMAGDHDLIRDEHTLEIYHHISNSELCIFPNATHGVPFDDPATFNATVERFFRTQFVKKDRIKDLLKSVERMRTRGIPPAPQ